MKPAVPIIRAFILAYAFLSAALYCSLMPLWEGFDELYHYGYVQHVATARTFPIIGKSMLSRELWASLDFLPVSHYIQPYLGRPSTDFDQYFRLTAEQRASLRRGADSIDHAWREEPSPGATYEAMQAPLTYLFLAPLESLLASAPLTSRVLVLRLFLSFITIALLWIGTRRLARRLGLQGPMEAACLFVVFSSQMFYAATCRIGNDALAAPWLLFFIEAILDSIEFPSFKRTARAALLMAVGLLIKSSLLVFVPLVFLAPIAVGIRGRLPLSKIAQHAAVSSVILGVLAGPWYGRNLRLYHNLTATVESTSGVGVEELLNAAVNVPWLRTIAETSHNGLWTGNNSFTTFSSSTLNVVLALVVLALVLYCLHARRTWPELITVLAIGLYGAGLVIITLVFFHSSHGAIMGPTPWYLQILLVPVLALAFLGLTRSAPWGQGIAISTILLWTYVAAVSWVAKLVPLYAGFGRSHARGGELLKWYLEEAGQRNSVLSNLCPAPAPVLYLLLTAVLATLLLAVASLAGVMCGPPEVHVSKQSSL